MRAGNVLLLCLVSGRLRPGVSVVRRSAVFAWVGLLVGAFLPYSYANYKRTKRFEKFEEMFPEAIDTLARAVRAGHAFTTALELIASEIGEPVASEFRKLFEEQKFGMPVRDALINLTERVPLVDVKFFVTAVMLQRETGGNLAEILDNLSYVIRERFKIMRQVRVHTAQGRLTMMLLMGLPPLIVIGHAGHESPIYPAPVCRSHRPHSDRGRHYLADDRLFCDPEDHSDSGVAYGTGTVAIVLFLTIAAVVFSFGAAVYAPSSVIGSRLRALGLQKSQRPLKPAFKERLEQALDPLSKALPLSPSDVSRTRTWLIQAGYRENRHLTIYVGSRVLLALLGMIVVIAVSGVQSLLLMIGVGGLGFFIPRFILKRMIRNRQRRITLALPDALDLTVICVEVGLALDQALMRVGEDLRHAHPELSDEFHLVNLEMRAGKPRVEALRNLAARTGVDDVRALVATLVQTDRFGTSVAQAFGCIPTRCARNVGNEPKSRPQKPPSRWSSPWCCSFSPPSSS